MRHIFSILCATTLLAAAAPSLSEPVRQLVFASCFKQTRPAPALGAVATSKPDVFVWMGDNIYGDTEDMEVLRRKFQTVLEVPAYARIRETARVIGTWDDHDYGKNDAGKEYPMKARSQQVLLDFLDVSEDSPRRQREGVYSLADFGPPGKRVRVILLDTRYHRDPIGSDGTILGEAQWQWLEKALTGSGARVNVLVSSIQVLPSEHRFEKWANFPKEKKRLLALLAREDVPPVILLSGDRHMAEISRDGDSCGYPLHEVTSSSLNQPIGGGEEPNCLRVGRLFRGANYGMLSIDWSGAHPVVTAGIRDDQGRLERSVVIDLLR